MTALDELNVDIARIEAEIIVLDARITAKMAAIDAQRGTPADDLRAMGIDRADLRWTAVRGYLRMKREIGVRELNRTLLRILAGGFILEAAEEHGNALWISRPHVLDAIGRTKRIYGAHAAQIVAETFVPLSLRDLT